MAAPRRPLISGARARSAAMQASQRTWRRLVSGPPQSGQLQKVGAFALVGFCSQVEAIAAVRAEALRAFTTACAARVRLRVSCVFR